MHEAFGDHTPVSAARRISSSRTRSGELRQVAQELSLPPIEANGAIAALESRDSALTEVHGAGQQPGVPLAVLL